MVIRGITEQRMALQDHTTMYNLCNIRCYILGLCAASNGKVDQGDLSEGDLLADSDLINLEP